MLDDAAFDAALAADGDEALTMLAAMTGATDERLRELARRLAGRVVVEAARGGTPRSQGVGRLRSRPAAAVPADLDVDASLDALVVARATSVAPPLDELVVREWARPDLAVCLVVDASGSMGGARLATAALAAAAAAMRAPADLGVLAFNDRVIAICSQGAARPVGAIVDDLLGLRGHGPTDLHLALEAARAQLARSRASRRLCVLLSDCAATVGDEPLIIARALDELVVIAPAGEPDPAGAGDPAGPDDAARFARAVGARLARVSGPSDVPGAFTAVVDR